MLCADPARGNVGRSDRDNSARVAIGIVADAESEDPGWSSMESDNFLQHARDVVVAFVRVAADVGEWELRRI